MKSAHWLLLLSLYTTQYVSLGFFTIAMVAILRSAGMPLERVSLIYLVTVCWYIKFLWAPLVDRYGIRRLGHYRSWLLVLQCIMVVLLLIIGQLDMPGQFPLILVLCLLQSASSATSDIAADALACRMLSPAERGLGNGVQAAGGLLGNILGGGLVLMAYPRIGWTGCLYLLAGIVSLTLLQLVFFDESKYAGNCLHQENETIRMSPISGSFIRLITFWQNGKKFWLALLLAFAVCLGLYYGLLTPFLMDRGWSMERVGLAVNIVGSAVGIAGAALTSGIIRRFGRKKALLFVAALLVTNCATLACASIAGSADVIVWLALNLSFCSYSSLSVILFTFMMDYAAVQTPGTDFTVQNCVFGLGGTVSICLGPVFASMAGYTAVFVTALVAGLLAFTLSLRFTVPVDKALERDAVL